MVWQSGSEDFRGKARVTEDYAKNLDRFYAILGNLEQTVGKRVLKDCNGRMNWPGRGVYFFFEDGEFRRDGMTPRVVRVGTHAVSKSKGSGTILWKRLRLHRGARHGGGRHRNSVFRLHVGGALLARDDGLLPKAASWGEGRSAPPEVCETEAHVEQAVSAYIGTMPFLWIQADDEPSKYSIRKIIESNAIALLSRSSATGAVADPPSESWLGHYCPHEDVRRSGLWNVEDTSGRYDTAFLGLLADCAARTEPA